MFSPLRVAGLIVMFLAGMTSAPDAGSEDGMTDHRATATQFSEAQLDTALWIDAFEKADRPSFRA
jgi:hypothetical protein